MERWQKPTLVGSIKLKQVGEYFRCSYITVSWAVNVYNTLHLTVINKYWVPRILHLKNMN